MRGIICAGAMVFGVAAWAGPVTVVDFSQAGHGWKGNPRTREARQDGGFSVELTGDEDPWLEGPAVRMPGFGEAKKLVVILDAESETKGPFLLFYAASGQGFSEERMVRLGRSPVDAAVYRAVLPLDSESMRLRLDPPGCTGRVILRSLTALPLVPRALPEFKKPAEVHLPAGCLKAAAGDIAVMHDPKRWNVWRCEIGGKTMAESNPAEALAYMDGKRVVTVDLSGAVAESEPDANGFSVRVNVRDEGGAVWRLERRFSSDRGSVRVVTSLEVSAFREGVHLPWLTFFSGVGSFGQNKAQALLPGVEYLENEPSSNEKEIRGAAADRRIPEAYKLCYPMMALAADGRWISLTWETADVAVSPLFDSPDRVFHSGGHVMGLWSPAVGDDRPESELTVYGGLKLEAGRPLTCVAALCGGEGLTAVPAMEAYVARKGLPPPPKFGNGFEDAVRLLAAGWLDSASRTNLMWRHAVWGSHFAPQPAQDPPAYLLWLASHTTEVALKDRLRDTARAVIESLPKGCFGTEGISHVRRPYGAFLYGDLAGLVRQAGPHVGLVAKRLVDGKARYQPGKTDYASTLGADHCNGYTAMSMEDLLAHATLTGDERAIEVALAMLDKLTVNYAAQVPRGAQPWEMPLHTPDLVASARLVRCYVLGYLLSGKPDYLAQARYWAWTGVSMIYLSPPTPQAIGLYATIGVIGATNWQAPNWIGQPVQWCGLVYRSALEDLARVDDVRRVTWQTLARGITLTGLQMCFPVDDPQRRGGLLPDYFLLRQQLSEGPAINPGTLQSGVAEAYGKTPLYTVTRLSNGSLAHVLGEAVQEAAVDGGLRLSVKAWPEDPHRLLVTRVGRAPSRVMWNGAPADVSFIEGARAIIVTVKGGGNLEIFP